MRARRLIIMIALTVWVLWAPVAISFGGCAGMGAMCQGPCLLSSYPLPTVPGPVALQAVEPLQGELSVYLPTPDLRVPTPPPRSILFSSLLPVTS
jgi:hypothetical protein